MQSATFSFSAPASGGPVSQYRIHQRTNGVQGGDTIIPSSQTSFTRSGLPAGTLIEFAVSAVGPGGVGSRSDWVGVTTDEPTEAPGVPGDLTVVLN